MIQTSARLLRLLTLLQSRRTWTGAELTERLEVTARTLRRDIDRLRTLGYPVGSTSGVAGGYSLGAGASLPPLMLEDREAVAVVVGLQIAAGSAVSGIGEASQQALAKLEQILPSRLQKRVKALRGSIVRLADGGPQVELNVVSQLAACADAMSLKFNYEDNGGVKTQRDVEPHRVVHVERRWYLVAWDKMREDWRTFRVDRMAHPITAGGPFTPRSSPDDDVAAYVTRSVMAMPYKLNARVLLHASHATMKAQLWPGFGRLEAVSAKRCRFYVGGSSLESLAMWLGVVGVDLRVVGERLLRAADA
jgi:predicted DNA-binding transcriptional regulator YafY